MQIRDKRCGENGKYLLDNNFTSVANTKIKPPLPPGPPPSKNEKNEKELVYIPEKDSDDEENKKEEK